MCVNEIAYCQVFINWTWDCWCIAYSLFILKSFFVLNIWERIIFYAVKDQFSITGISTLPLENPSWRSLLSDWIYDIPSIDVDFSNIPCFHILWLFIYLIWKVISLSLFLFSENTFYCDGINFNAFKITTGKHHC